MAKPPASTPFPALNWAELHQLILEWSFLTEESQALFVNKIIVPERPYCAVGSLPGYFKSEWALKLASRREERIIQFSVRPQFCYIALCDGKGPKASAKATHSGFDLSMAKELKGKRLIRIEALPRERVVILWFGPGAGDPTVGLALYLVPSNPEAFLISYGSSSQTGAQMLARSRAGQALTAWIAPDGSRAPANPVVRTAWVTSPHTYFHVVENALSQHAYELRQNQALRALRESADYFSKRIELNERALSDALADAPWKRYGDLLKGSLALAGNAARDGGASTSEGTTGHSEVVTGNSDVTLVRDPEVLITKRADRDTAKLLHFRAVFDFEQDEWLEIPVTAKLNARAQVEKFYQLARRNQRRKEEAILRLETLKIKYARVMALLPDSRGSDGIQKNLTQNLAETSPDHSLKNKTQIIAQNLPANLTKASATTSLQKPDWALLKTWEEAAGLTVAGKGALAASDNKSDKKTSALASRWEGRSVVTAGGWTILVGRNKNENLELTFKIARGNDLWFHVRGKPGAHVVIPVPSGKSVPLPALLDAAMLAVFYSDGEKWGKTEVDYTFKKYVKRIKDSSEASYTQNKTLIVAVDPLRIKDLLGDA